GPFVASHVLHRFLVPRHPPCALKNLATDARVHCAVLKQRPATRHPQPELEYTGAGTRRLDLDGRTLRHPTTCPAPFPLPSFVPRPEGQYWKEKTVKSA